MKLQSFLGFAPFALCSPLNQTWDYIIVGSGAAGIPLADRLSESGKSVLLIERGFPSSGRWGGAWKPAWLEGTNLTRFDVPALAQLVWSTNFDNTGIRCDDVVDVTASCVLGGGPAINAGQFYLPTPGDFDLNQPLGFRYADVQTAIRKAASRLPWTDTPSSDGKLYLTNATQIAIDALTNTSLTDPFRFIRANDELDDRNRTSSLFEFFFSNGEKGGPMATYLVTADRREKFRLQMNTTVTRILRKWNIATGVQVEETYPGGLNGEIHVTPGTGRVILSAGVFGTFKILLRSGIGPADELAQLSNHTTESKHLPKRKDWIELPVRYNLDDTPSITLAVSLPYLEIYDWEGLYNSTPEQRPEISQYLRDRSGPLSILQPSSGPISFEEIVGEDNKKRIVQWDVTSAGGMGIIDGGFIGFSANLDLGKTSRGRLTLLTQNTTSPFVKVSIPPYFNDPGDHDFKAILTSATNVLSIIQNIPSASVFYPPPGVPLEAYLRQAIATSGPALTRNHWVGSTKMGASCEDEGAVVDISTRVCGMQNLHVVDAGIVNGVPTANPQAVIIVVAEKAAEIILGLD
ncbi:hypothetical protein ACN47E_000092 [Coniothyrium glycines]